MRRAGGIHNEKKNKEEEEAKKEKKTRKDKQTEKQSKTTEVRTERRKTVRMNRIRRESQNEFHKKGTTRTNIMRRGRRKRTE